MIPTQNDFRGFFRNLFGAFAFIIGILIVVIILSSMKLEQERTNYEQVINELELRQQQLDVDIQKVKMKNDTLEIQNKKLQLEIDRLTKELTKAKEVKSNGVSFTRGSSRSYKLLATGYTPDYHLPPYYGKTASGKMAKPWHTVAVDPKQFPLGTIFYIEALKKYNGTGIYVATDTGGVIDHGDIDICVPTKEACYSEIGKRYIEVEVIEWGKSKK